MSALLPLPKADELTLTPVELECITGAALRRRQVEWLKSNRWIFALSRAGDPVVGRLYANLKLGGLEMTTFVQPQAWEPDFTLLNS